MVKVQLFRIHYQAEQQVADVVVVLHVFLRLPVFLGKPLLRLHRMHERIIISILLSLQQPPFRRSFAAAQQEEDEEGIDLRFDAGALCFSRRCRACTFEYYRIYALVAALPLWGGVSAVISLKSELCLIPESDWFLFAGEFLRRAILFRIVCCVKNFGSQDQRPLH